MAPPIAVRARVDRPIVEGLKVQQVSCKEGRSFVLVVFSKEV